MKSEVATNYLQDCLKAIKEKALESKDGKEKSGDQYAIGHLMAYHEVVSLLQSQAIAFGIPLEDISLDDINPDLDLL